MPVILTATDFSSVAENAVDYACQLAIANGAGVVVLHSFRLPIMFSDIPIPGSVIDREQEEAQTQMNGIVAGLIKRYPGLPVNGKVIYGDTIDILDDYSESNEPPLLVVVGNSSMSEDTSWSESILINTIKSLRYPVLAVPPDATYGQVSKVCFAIDNKEGGYATAVPQLARLVIKMNLALHALHVKPAAAAHEKIHHVNEQTLAPLIPVYHELSDVVNVDEAILDFVKKNSFDWLVLMTRKHSFFEALLHKSHTRALVQHSTMPVLAIHEAK
jgi:nucleotide-binding universal stress UspA family protein